MTWSEGGDRKYVEKRTAIPHDEADWKKKRNGEAAKERRRLVVVGMGSR